MKQKPLLWTYYKKFTLNINMNIGYNLINGNIMVTLTTRELERLLSDKIDFRIKTYEQK